MCAILEVWLRNRININEDVIRLEKRGGHEGPHRRGEYLSRVSENERRFWGQMR